MANLYELGEAEKQLLEMFESGDIPEEALNDTLQSLDIENKLEAYCKVIRQMQADSGAFKAEADNFSKKQKAADNGAQRLKTALVEYLNKTNKKKASAGLFTISTRESQAVNIIDSLIIPKAYLKPQEYKIDKAKIKKELSSGKVVPGAELQTNVSLLIK